jgi:transposase
MNTGSKPLLSVSFPPRSTDTRSELTLINLGRKCLVPPPHPPEFRRRAVELARTGDKSVSVLAKSLGISQSCLSNWIRQAAIDDGDLDGLSAGEKKELAELRRKARQLELENEILKRAAAYFARENVLPK